jgi:hypothetical protein
MRLDSDIKRDLEGELSYQLAIVEYLVRAVEHVMRSG